LLGDVRRFRPTHVFAPEFNAIGVQLPRSGSCDAWRSRDTSSRQRSGTRTLLPISLAPRPSITASTSTHRIALHRAGTSQPRYFPRGNRASSTTRCRGDLMAGTRIRPCRTSDLRRSDHSAKRVDLLSRQSPSCGDPRSA
jgi:hypothetical protein